MQITASVLLTYLHITVSVLVIIVLYHILFIVVDARKIMRRIEDITAQAEELLLKPVALTDQALSWVLSQVEHFSNEKKAPTKKKLKKG